MYKHGWFQVAFERDIEADLTAVSIGNTRIVLVKTKSGIQAYSADCPHRGAHLALGGELKDDCIVCPFHGYPVGLGEDAKQNFRTPAYDTLNSNGLIFVRLSDKYENGFRTFLADLAETHVIFPGFIMPVQAPAALVTENGFDSHHFPAVHGILNHPKFDVSSGDKGELVVSSLFKIPSLNPFKPAPQAVPYLARTFSPGLIVVKLAGDNPYSVITATTPISANEARIHLSLALPIDHYGAEPSADFVKHILKHSRNGLEDDQVMWENLSPNLPPTYVQQDAPILAFHQFCHQFNGNGVAV